MKSCLFLMICFLSLSTDASSQTMTDTTRIIFENEKLKVIEYVSTPGKDICGPGVHYHPAHLSILFTDAKATVTSVGGKKSVIELKAGTAFWSEAETHTAVNSGNKPVKAYVVEFK